MIDNTFVDPGAFVRSRASLHALIQAGARPLLLWRARVIDISEHSWAGSWPSRTPMRNDLQLYTPPA
jgi:hypothetical protein